MITKLKDGRYLTRLRADPATVRVAIRRVAGGMHMVTVSGSDSDCEIVETHSCPRSAIYRALLGARAAGIQGIDLDMAWAYEHPQYTVAS